MLRLGSGSCRRPLAPNLRNKIDVLRLDVDRIMIVWITIWENLLWSVSYWLRMRATLVLHIPMDDVSDTLDHFQGGRFVRSLLHHPTIFPSIFVPCLIDDTITNHSTADKHMDFPHNLVVECILS